GAGEEDLEPIAGPFSVLGEHIRWAQQGTPFRAYFVKEKAEATPRVRVSGNTGRRLQPLCGDEQQVRIERMDAERVCAGGTESISENVLRAMPLWYGSGVCTPRLLLQVVYL